MLPFQNNSVGHVATVMKFKIENKERGRSVSHGRNPSVATTSPPPSPPLSLSTAEASSGHKAVLLARMAAAGPLLGMPAATCPGGFMR
jgi:hypothetical protein